MPRKRSFRVLHVLVAGMLLASSTMPTRVAAAAADAAPLQRDRAWLVAEAQNLAEQPYEQPAMSALGALDDLSYDQYREIRFRSEAAVWADEQRGFVLDLLHPGFLFKTPVQINTIEAGGRSQSVAFSHSLFDYGKDVAPPTDDTGLAFTGLRVRYSINRPDVLDEVMVFQGASYFRAVARNQRYGISARGLAVNTASNGGEEFPAFTRFWVERPEAGAAALIVHALLDSPSVTGAYSFVIRPGEDTVTEVELDLFPRADLTDIGIAPLTSMFLFDTSNRGRFDDYRNEVHDSDGLQMLSGQNERIWRPLANPLRLQISMFIDENPQGFGLVQRQRRFSDYQDYEARYELRPSAWVEPVGSWGPGFVELIEIPTDREMHDNIVVFWRPRDPLVAGQSYHFAYRLHWCAQPPDVTSLARVAATRSGLALDGKRRLFIVDFTTKAAIPAGLKPVLTSSAGRVLNVTGEFIKPTSAYRISFAFEPGDSTLSELRLQLVADDQPWSETWLYRWTR